MDEPLNLTINTIQAEQKLDETKADALETEQMVKKVAENSKQLIGLTREQTIAMATHAWNITSKTMEMMGLTIGQGFKSVPR